MAGDKILQHVAQVSYDCLSC
ncbi:hypothetical protein [Lactiplantibacillus plantarum]|nr:hypothetical protein [Lactiplantibacillus plantarum]